jgi:hypothetical protein
MIVRILFLIILGSLNFSSFASTLSPVPLISLLEDEGWKPWMIELNQRSFHLMSVKEDLTQAVIIKPTLAWDAKYKANTWYDTQEGSTYFLKSENVSVYILDFSKRAVTNELKNKILNILKSQDVVKTTFQRKSSFSLFPTAHASECAAPNGMNSSVNNLSSFASTFNQTVVPFDGSAIWDMLNRCGSKVINDTLHDLKQMATDPIAWLKDTWHGLASIVDFVGNFMTVMPKVFEDVKQMSATQLFDVLCPVATKVLLGVLTGKLASDAVTISIQLIKELKVVKELMKAAKALPKIIHVKPKLPHLTIKNGRLPAATLEMQAKSVAKMTKGEISINGQALQPSKQYTGIILDDGRMLLQDRRIVLHNELVRDGDKVGTAFELWTNAKGKILMVINQSGTYAPDYKGCQQWMKWWAEKQRGIGKLGFEDKHGTGLPFKVMEYKN